MEYFGIFGVVAFVMVCGISDELKKLKRKMAGVDKILSRFKNKEEIHMSRLIEELKGRWCEIDSEDLLDEKVQVCDVDEEWVRVRLKKDSAVQLIRIDSIDSVKILEEKVQGDGR